MSPTAADKSLADLVLSELRETKGEIKELRTALTNVRVDIAGLKVKAGVWGGLAGLVSAAVAVAAAVVAMLSKMGGG